MMVSIIACRESGEHTAAQPNAQSCRDGGAAGCGGDSSPAAQLRADGAKRQVLMQVMRLHHLAKFAARYTLVA